MTLSSSPLSELTPHLSACGWATTQFKLLKNKITTEIWIGEESYTTTFLVMPLPSGVDAILGMDWLNDNDIWLHPASKRMLVPSKPGTTSDHNALHALANLCPVGAANP